MKKDYTLKDMEKELFSKNPKARKEYDREFQSLMLFKVKKPEDQEKDKPGEPEDKK